LTFGDGSMMERQTPLPGDGIPQTIYALTEMIQRRLMVLFKGTGLHWGLRRILQRLWIEDGLSQAELARTVRSSEASTSNMLKHLVEGGWVERRRDRYDYRISRVHLTAKATQLRESVTEECSSIDREIRTLLSDELGEQLGGLLDLVWERWGEVEDREEASGRGIGLHAQPSPPGEL
jgi:DNA-binding MarR family transcriptional regulator